MPRVWLLALVLTVLGLAACGGGSDAPSAGAGCEGIVAGDFVVTEVLANPVGEDSGGEWFELYNASGAERSLRGLCLVAARADGSSEKTHLVGADGPVVPAGGYAVVGDGEGAAYSYGKDLGGLANGGGGYPLLSTASQYENAHGGRIGHWKIKLIGTQTPRLYTLASDPGARNDVWGKPSAQIGARLLLDPMWLLRNWNVEWKKAQWGNAAVVSSRFAADLGE